MLYDASPKMRSIFTTLHTHTHHTSTRLISRATWGKSLTVPYTKRFVLCVCVCVKRWYLNQQPGARNANSRRFVSLWDARRVALRIIILYVCSWCLFLYTDREMSLSHIQDVYASIREFDLSNTHQKMSSIYQSKFYYIFGWNWFKLFSTPTLNHRHTQTPPACRHNMWRRPHTQSPSAKFNNIYISTARRSIFGKIGFDNIDDTHTHVFYYFVRIFFSTKIWYYFKCLHNKDAY